MTFFQPQNPGIGGLNIFTIQEELFLVGIASLGDPGADRILFWDDSAGSVQYLEIGSGLSITGTIISATGGGGGTPAGTDGMIQFNDEGSFGGSAIISTPDNGGTFYIQDKFNLIVNDGDSTKAFRFEASGLTAGALRILTPQDSSGTLAYLGNKLSAFASTTSAELATVISDETGTGALVFADSPTLLGTVTVPATNFTVGASIPFSDSAGTLTLQNVDALDATTEATIESAIDTLSNLTTATSLTTIDTSLTGPLRADAGVLSAGFEAFVHTFSTTSTSYVSITGLNSTLAINTTYVFSVVGQWTSSNNSGQASIGITLPTGATFTMTRTMGRTSSAVNSVMQSSNDQSQMEPIGTGTAIRTVQITGIIDMGGTAGDVQFRLVSNNASYTATVQNMYLTGSIIN